VTVVVSHSAAAGFAPNDELGGGLGQYGASIFFVPSGYLMGMIYAGREPAAHWRGYAIARGARVLPLFYAVLLVSASATAIAGIFRINVPSDQFLIYGSSILWTIPVEVQFYCIVVGLWFLSPWGGRWFWHGTLAASLASAAILGVNGSPIQGENCILACWQHFFIFGTVFGVAGATGGAARFIAALYWIDFNAWNPRLRLAMMASGSARQTNGLAPSLLRSAAKLLMAAWRSTTEQNTPRLRRRRVSVAKKPSTAVSHEPEVGVKGKVRRGWRSGHARMWAA
jgi:peptidoglycan/LPS O-acetylase OafA/YrhL